MKRELVGAGVATAVLLGGAFLGSAATAQTAATDTPVAVSASPVKNPDAQRERQQGFGAQDAGAVTRVSGANRYETAANIAAFYGWDWTNTTTVYIAGGAAYADALAIGLSSQFDGPLLLVQSNGIPSVTRAALEDLQPCFIDVMGGTASVSNAVLTQLEGYAYPELCMGE